MYPYLSPEMAAGAAELMFLMATMVATMFSLMFTVRPSA